MSNSSYDPHTHALERQIIDIFADSEFVSNHMRAIALELLCGVFPQAGAAVGYAKERLVGRKGG